MLANVIVGRAGAVQYTSRPHALYIPDFHSSAYDDIKLILIAEWTILCLLYHWALKKGCFSNFSFHKFVLC